MNKKHLLNILTTYLYYFCIMVFLVSFNFQDTRTGGWVRQFLPSSIGSAQINDITFVDSLNGFAVTGFNSTNQCFILKTSNGGNNWVIKYSDSLAPLFSRIKFISKGTGYAVGDDRLYKTWNSGENWTYQILPGLIYPTDIFVLNKDTMWLADPDNGFGGLWRTTNAGQSWQRQYSIGITGNPNKIYMYNAQIGFMSAGNYILKTTNSGQNWNIIVNNNYFEDIHFSDSITGYYANFDFYKTTNGGINWQVQTLPNVPGVSQTNRWIKNFTYIQDTIYGVYGNIFYPNFSWRAIIYKSTNKGINWGYQIPDTSFRLFNLSYSDFINGKLGWCYRNNQGIYTNSGGDSTFYTNIKKSGTIISDKYLLYQNYPNPFNSETSIKYKVSRHGGSSTFKIKINVFDIAGKEIATVINGTQRSGDYEVKFDGKNLSSGIYFYSLIVDENRIDTKKMILIK